MNTAVACLALIAFAVLIFLVVPLTAEGLDGADQRDAFHQRTLAMSAPHEQDELSALLELAHGAVTWADQCWNAFRGTPGANWYLKRRDEYMRARLDYFASRRPLTVSDIGGCRCRDLHARIDSDCMYHAGAAAQPWNHGIPQNCPTYWDGCNCEGGPFYAMPSEATAR